MCESETLDRPVPECSKCGGQMEVGFCPENVTVRWKHVVAQHAWIPGDPEYEEGQPGLIRINRGHAARALAIVTWRCTNCGFLEAYAPTPK